MCVKHKPLQTADGKHKHGIVVEIVCVSPHTQTTLMERERERDCDGNDELRELKTIKHNKNSLLA
jgi:hypothetical protein